MKKEIKEILEQLEIASEHNDFIVEIRKDRAKLLFNYITNLQQENKIKDTNWESLKYYLEKLYYKDYIEEAISDDIDKKIKELESKVEIKGYQKDIKALQQENERLKDELERLHNLLNSQAYRDLDDYKSRCEKAIEYINYSIDNSQPFYEYLFGDEDGKVENLDKLLNILQNGSEKE